MHANISTNKLSVLNQSNQIISYYNIIAYSTSRVKEEIKNNPLDAIIPLAH